MIIQEEETEMRIKQKENPIVVRKISQYVPIEGHVELIDFISVVLEMCLKDEYKTEVFEQIFYYLKDVRKRASMLLDEYMFLIPFLTDHKTIAAVKKVDLDKEEFLSYPCLFTDFIEWIQSGKK